MEQTKTLEKEKAVLVFAFTGEPALEQDRRERELQELVRSCGGIVEATVIQNLTRFSPRTLIGSGKVEEIAEYVENHGIDLVVFETELTGAQRGHLSDAISCKILDRVDLILDIFALRARTPKAKIDVAYAQLAYRLPNLRGYGEALSRTGGGIGTRGPGEQKLESDRRSVEAQMKRLRAQREKIATQEKESAKKRHRSRLPIVSLIGYTNAGKSTILNSLVRKYGMAEKEVYADDRLFATLEVSLRHIMAPEEPPYLLADTIGFIHDLPEKLMRPFESTLAEIESSDLLVMVIDAQEEGVKNRVDTVLDMTADLRGNTPVLYVMNKSDLGAQPQVTPPEDTLFISALRGEDVEALHQEILRRLYGEVRARSFQIPYAKMSKMQDLRKYARILKEEAAEAGLQVDALAREGLSGLLGFERAGEG